MHAKIPPINSKGDLIKSEDIMRRDSLSFFLFSVFSFPSGSSFGDPDYFSSDYLFGNSY